MIVMNILTSLRAPLVPVACALALGAAAPSAHAQHSVAREWNELLLSSIRMDFARPTVHARNLYHVSTAMWDAWATYDFTGKPLLFDEDHATNDPAVDSYREEALSYACYRILNARFATSPGAATMLPQYTSLMNTLGYNPGITTVVGNTPAAIGNRIASTVLAYGLADNSNEAGGYVNQHYLPINTPLVPALPGNPTLTHPNRWQPLALQFFVDQSGNVIPFGYPEFLSPEWGDVSNFALSQHDLTVNTRGNFDYWTFHDPGPPPMLGTPTAAEYKKGFEMVAVWSSHLDPADGVMIDVSPGAIGNAPLPAGQHEWDLFYDFANGGDWGPGHAVNPHTGQPYAPQMVPRGDYARVLAEFWADGPDSETPPGHWFTILNYVSDHPLFQKRIGGAGPVLGDLEWDVKSYIALGGAMHDCAVSAWGVKGWYDYLRPVSAIRYLADLGQCTDQLAGNYHADGINLRPGLIEQVTPATTAVGQRHEHLLGEEGKIAVKAWRGPNFITNPATDVAGVDWILVENWWPYQRPTFVTPPFAGYVSGHSTFSRAAAVVMDNLTGSAFFPGGMGEFVCQQDNFLVFEKGPSQTVRLQWATYYDASDQTSLSRIWGGIHPRADDIPGREMGQEIGTDAFALAAQLWAGTAAPKASYSILGAGCVGSNGAVTLEVEPASLPVVGRTMNVIIDNLPVAAVGTTMVLGFNSYVPGIDLSLIGMPTCTLGVNVEAQLVLPAAGGTAVFSLPIPNDPLAMGIELFHQALTLDPGANALGVTTSETASALIGR